MANIIISEKEAVEISLALAYRLVHYQEIGTADTQRIKTMTHARQKMIDIINEARRD